MITCTARSNDLGFLILIDHAVIIERYQPLVGAGGEGEATLSRSERNLFLQACITSSASSDRKELGGRVVQVDEGRRS